MGCGSSSPSSVLDGDGVNGKLARREGAGRGVRPQPTGAAADDDIPTEVLPEPTPAPVKPPLAFEIPVNDGEESGGTQGLVKKHPPKPPKRLQRLNTMETTPPKLSDLQGKMESAEKRRQSILQSRIASANKVTRQFAKTHDMNGNNDDEETLDIDDLLNTPSSDKLKNVINVEEQRARA